MGIGSAGKGEWSAINEWGNTSMGGAVGLGLKRGECSLSMNSETSK